MSESRLSFQIDKDRLRLAQGKTLRSYAKALSLETAGYKGVDAINVHGIQRLPRSLRKSYCGMAYVFEV